MDFLLYGIYINMYIFVFFKEDSYHKGVSALDTDCGWHKTFTSTESLMMLSTFISVEIFLYLVSVREARKRAIYQEFNKKENYWPKDQEQPNIDRIKQTAEFEVL